MRGIGVAVMCSTCGARPSTSAERCSTPKRCCSSTTATARSRNSKPFWISACVPTTTSAWPPIFDLHRAGDERAADAELHADALDREEVLLGERLGRRHQRALASRLDRAQERVERDHRLAGADVALEQPLHRRRAREVGVDLARSPPPGARSARTAAPRGSGRSARRARGARRRPAARARPCAGRAPTWSTSSSSKASRCRPSSASSSERGWWIERRARRRGAAARARPSAAPGAGRDGRARAAAPPRRARAASRPRSPRSPDRRARSRPSRSRR